MSTYNPRSTHLGPFYTANILDAFRDLTPFVQFKKREKLPRRSVTFSKVAACNFTKSNTPPWEFFTFLNCTNGAKLGNVSYIWIDNIKINESIITKWVNPFHAAGLFLYPLKTSGNLWFSYVFKGYRKRPIV